jgi:UDP-2,4-diacetamido-2,4,6-trideoxy-beta-L-altropyranose hydrolase
MNLKVKVYVRVDGYTEIGLGHLYRCISLATMLTKFFNIVFVCKKIPNDIVQIILNENFGFFQIENEEIFFELINKNDLIVVDGYGFNYEYQQKIKSKKCKLVIIDDLHEGLFSADLIINQNPSIGELDYNVEKPVSFALGLNYVLLRHPFIAAANSCKSINDTKTIFICFGGADKFNLTETALIESLKFSKIKKIFVVTGVEYKHFNQINNYSLKYNKVKHYHNLSADKMCELMVNSDLGIVPSSGIVLEALACKLNIISGMYADNQKLLYKYLSDNKYIIKAGSFKKDDINAALVNALNNPTNFKNLIDGKSTFRIYYKFLDLICGLRKIKLSDIDLLFNWANVYEVRNNSMNKSEITWESHNNWFHSKIQSKNSYIFILELYEKPIGQIRFDLKSDCWEIDYSIDKNFQGVGLGKYLITKSLLYMKNKLIKGNVLSTNISSIKIFQSLGFNNTSSYFYNNELYFTFLLNN